MPTPNRYLNELQRASERADAAERALKRGAKNDFVPTPEWLTSRNIRRWTFKAVLFATPFGEKWIPLSALRAFRVVDGSEMAIPFGAACDDDRKEIASWFVASLGN